MIPGIVASRPFGLPPPAGRTQLVWGRSIDTPRAAFIKIDQDGTFVAGDTFSANPTTTTGFGLRKHPSDPNLISGSASSGFQFFRRAGTIWSPVNMTSTNLIGLGTVRDYAWSPDGSAFVVCQNASPWFSLFTVVGDTYTIVATGVSTGTATSAKTNVTWRNNTEFTLGGSPNVAHFLWDGANGVTQLGTSSLNVLASIGNMYWSSNGAHLVCSLNGTPPWAVLNWSGSVFTNANVTTPTGSTSQQTYMSPPKPINEGDVYNDYFVMSRGASGAYILRRTDTTWSYVTLASTVQPQAATFPWWDSTGNFLATTGSSGSFLNYYQKVSEDYMRIDVTAFGSAVSSLCLL